MLVPNTGWQAPATLFLFAVAVIVPALSGVVVLRREFGLWAYPIAILLTLIAMALAIASFLLLLRFGGFEGI